MDGETKAQSEPLVFWACQWHGTDPNAGVLILLQCCLLNSIPALHAGGQGKSAIGHLLFWTSIKEILEISLDNLVPESFTRITLTFTASHFSSLPSFHRACDWKVWRRIAVVILSWIITDARTSLLNFCTDPCKSQLKNCEIFRKLWD